MITTDEFIELYTQTKRHVTKIPFIKKPIPDSKQYNVFTQVTEIVNNLHADPVDYIRFMIRFYSPMRIFPQPFHLKAEKAVMKYRNHQGLKNVFRYNDYSTDGDSLLIHATNEAVSIRFDIYQPVDKDIRLKYVMHSIDNLSSNVDDKLRKDIHYAIVKLTILNRPIQSKLLEWKEISV